KLKKYLKVLKIEMEDLVEDLNTLKNLYNRRKNKGEITHYVFLENFGLLTEEISGINGLLSFLETVQTDKYTTLDEMIADIDRIFRERTKHYGFPEAVYVLIHRKMKKVTNYVSRE
ncbi:MAG: hypothetical protein AB1798_16900, partial [Spirochaetota bacterium]